MKIPKTIDILHKQYKIVPDKKINGGSFNSWKHEIRYNPQDTKDDILEVLIHEVLENLLSVRHHRWQMYNESDINNEMLFSFNHNEFEQLIIDICGIVKQLGVV